MIDLLDIFNENRRLIGVYGTDKGDCSEVDVAAAQRVGQVLYAPNGQHVLLSGACAGMPSVISNSFRRAGGVTVGISPGSDMEQHIKSYGNPVQPYRHIVFVNQTQGLDFPRGFAARRDLVMDYLDAAVIFKGGLGTLLEVGLLLHDHDAQLFVINGYGGTADLLVDLVDEIERGVVTLDNLLDVIRGWNAFPIKEDQLQANRDKIYYGILRAIHESRLHWIHDIEKQLPAALCLIQPSDKSAEAFSNLIHHTIRIDYPTHV